jgi:hypothetical protein
MHSTVLRPSATIRYADIDGLYVILDLKTAKYFVLNEAASRMWAALSGDRTPETPEHGGGHHEIFEQDCLRRGFVTAISNETHVVEMQPIPAVFRIPAWQAWFSLACTAWSLRTRGFAATYESYARFGCTPLGLAEQVSRRERGAAAFLAAENLLWRRRAPEDCLPRSLALYRFMRGIGVPAIHRIGGRRVPTFAMHAWVEHCGVVVLDDPRNATELTMLSSIPSV